MSENIGEPVYVVGAPEKINKLVELPGTKIEIAEANSTFATLIGMGVPILPYMPVRRTWILRRELESATCLEYAVTYLPGAYDILTEYVHGDIPSRMLVGLSMVARGEQRQSQFFGFRFGLNTDRVSGFALDCPMSLDQEMLGVVSTECRGWNMFFNNTGNGLELCQGDVGSGMGQKLDSWLRAT